MALKALKLEIPRPNASPRRLCVKNGYGRSVKVDDSKFQGKHVVSCGDDAILVKNFFGVNNKVPDVSRYRIGAGGCCVRHDNRYHICNDRYLIPHCDVSRKDLARLLQRQQRQIRNIVLLLESPHKDEYQPGNINCPIAPANGATGDNIDRCLGTVLRQIKGALINARLDEAEFIKPDSHVIISNPIQFQTSLYAIHGQSTWVSRWGMLRNNVWRTLWNEDHIQDCFLERLCTYNPSLIVNACTGALEKRVNDFIRDNLEDEQDVMALYNVPHPASKLWNSGDIDPVRIHLPDNSNADNQ